MRLKCRWHCLLIATLLTNLSPTCYLLRVEYLCVFVCVCICVCLKTTSVLLPHSRLGSRATVWRVSTLQPSLTSLMFLPTSREAGAENWGTEGCQTVASTTVHTKCLCSRISTYSVLAQQAKDPVSGWCTCSCIRCVLRMLRSWGQVSRLAGTVGMVQL